MRNFHWRPRGSSDDDPALAIQHNEDYSGDATCVVPLRYVSVSTEEFVARSGEKFTAAVIHLPARALAEFGLRAARDRVGALLEKLLGDLDVDAVES